MHTLIHGASHIIGIEKISRSTTAHVSTRHVDAVLIAVIKLQTTEVYTCMQQAYTNNNFNTNCIQNSYLYALLDVSALFSWEKALGVQQ